MDCYHFKLIQFDYGFLDKSVDATYVIHLEGNQNRLTNIYTQLNKYPLTKINYILFNKGYKVCDKNLPLQVPSVDLIDSFLTILKDAKEKQYNNILILEDDFFYDKNIKNIKIQNDINTFLNDNKNKEFMYSLGSIPYLQTPFFTHNQLFFSTGCHAVIYTKSIQEKILSNDIYSYFKFLTPDWDIYSNLYCTRYTYYKPLCYQLFPNTENSKHWERYIFNLGYIIKKLFCGFLLNKDHYPGYNYFYIISKIQFIIIIIILLKVLSYKLKLI
jgi:hypothetical protein